jgi:hypothetical protein
MENNTLISWKISLPTNDEYELLDDICSTQLNESFKYGFIGINREYYSLLTDFLLNL